MISAAIELTAKNVYQSRKLLGPEVPGRATFNDRSVS